MAIEVWILEYVSKTRNSFYFASEGPPIQQLLVVKRFDQGSEKRNKN